MDTKTPLQDYKRYNTDCGCEWLRYRVYEGSYGPVIVESDSDGSFSYRYDTAKFLGEEHVTEPEAEVALIEILVQRILEGGFNDEDTSQSRHTLRGVLDVRESAQQRRERKIRELLAL